MPSPVDWTARGGYERWGYMGISYPRHPEITQKGEYFRKMVSRATDLLTEGEDCRCECDAEMLYKSQQESRGRNLDMRRAYFRR